MKTVTLPNVPDELYAKLEADASRHGRSVADEAVEQIARNYRVSASPDEAWERASALRDSLGVWVDHSIVDELINDGRR